MCINWGGLFSQLGIGVLSSTIVLSLGYLIAYEQYLKKKFKRLNDVELKNKELKKHGFVKSWDNQREAENQLLEDIKKSKKIYVFTTRGGTFSNTDQNEIAKFLFSDKFSIKRILLSHQDNAFLVKREQELEKAKKEKVNNLEIEVKNSFDKLIQEFGKDSVKQHRENPVRYRLILLEEYMYISQQLENKCSQESPITKYNKDSFWYPILSAEFEGLWGKY
jgi:predicted lactoylglutathione lyase